MKQRRLGVIKTSFSQDIISKYSYKRVRYTGYFPLVFLERGDNSPLFAMHYDLNPMFLLQFLNRHYKGAFFTKNHPQNVSVNNTYVTYENRVNNQRIEQHNKRNTLENRKQVQYQLMNKPTYKKQTSNLNTYWSGLFKYKELQQNALMNHLTKSFEQRYMQFSNSALAYSTQTHIVQKSENIYESLFSQFKNDVAWFQKDIKKNYVQNHLVNQTHPLINGSDMHYSDFYSIHTKKMDVLNKNQMVVISNKQGVTLQNIQTYVNEQLENILKVSTIQQSRFMNKIQQLHHTSWTRSNVNRGSVLEVVQNNRFTSNESWQTDQIQTVKVLSNVFFNQVQRYSSKRVFNELMHTFKTQLNMSEQGFLTLYNQAYTEGTTHISSVIQQMSKSAMHKIQKQYHVLMNLNTVKKTMVNQSLLDVNQLISNPSIVARLNRIFLNSRVLNIKEKYIHKNTKYENDNQHIVNKSMATEVDYRKEIEIINNKISRNSNFQTTTDRFDLLQYIQNTYANFDLGKYVQNTYLNKEMSNRVLAMYKTNYDKYTTMIQGMNQKNETINLYHKLDHQAEWIELIQEFQQEHGKATHSVKSNQSVQLLQQISDQSLFWSNTFKNKLKQIQNKHMDHMYSTRFEKANTIVKPMFLTHHTNRFRMEKEHDVHKAYQAIYKVQQRLDFRTDHQDYKENLWSMIQRVAFTEQGKIDKKFAIANTYGSEHILKDEKAWNIGLENNVNQVLNNIVSAKNESAYNVSSKDNRLNVVVNNTLNSVVERMVQSIKKNAVKIKRWQPLFLTENIDSMTVLGTQNYKTAKNTVSNDAKSIANLFETSIQQLVSNKLYKNLQQIVKPIQNIMNETEQNVQNITYNQNLLVSRNNQQEINQNNKVTYQEFQKDGPTNIQYLQENNIKVEEFREEIIDEQKRIEKHFKKELNELSETVIEMSQDKQLQKQLSKDIFKKLKTDRVRRGL